ncbi:MAG: hypothetical protein AAF501_06380 [Pseudomonadota bacterium]
MTDVTVRNPETASLSVFSDENFAVILATKIAVQIYRNETLELGGMPLDTLDRFLPKGLLIVSSGLLCWGLLGLSEYAFPALNLGLQDIRFPAGLQFLHFFALVLTGSVFVFGYLNRWPYTPYATITMYAVLATLCFIETMDFGAFGGGITGVMIMLMEFALYIGLSSYLLHSTAIHHHFHHASRRSDV